MERLTLIWGTDGRGAEKKNHTQEQEGGTLRRAYLTVVS